MIRIVASIVLCALSGLLLDGASAAGQQKPLTLKQAEDLAIKLHPRISAAQLKALAAKQVWRENRAPYFPVITANATAVGVDDDNTRIAAGGLNNPLILERNAEGINVSQLVTDFGRTSELVAGSKLKSRAEEENALATRAQVILEVDAGYFAALQARSVLSVAKQMVATRQLIFDQVSELATNKLKSGLDMSFARVSLEEGKLLYSNAENDLKAALASLAALIGGQEAWDHDLVDIESKPESMTDATDLVQEALKNRPDLVRMRLESQAADKFADAEKALHYPSITAVATAGFVPYHDSRLHENYEAAGVNFSLPIFDGMLFTAREKAARLYAQAAMETVRDEENQVARDVRIAALNLSYAASRIKLADELEASASEAFELAQVRYKVGSSSIVELSQAQLSKTEAQIAQAKARYQYETKKAIIDYQTGRMR